MKQGLKTLEEVTELLVAIADGDRDEVVDAIGDIFVTLVMQANAWDVNVEDCVALAYDTISKRNGKMVKGVFVKDA
jgi:NTP pyrophosphatase (non-canonical NTP hydrolase)